MYRRWYYCYVNSSKITKLEEAFVSIIGAISVWSAFSFPIYSWMNTARRQANHEVSEIMVHVDVGAEIGTPSEDGQEQEQEHKVRQHTSSSPPSTFYILHWQNEDGKVVSWWKQWQWY